MDYPFSPDRFFSDACLIYIIAGLFCAIIRRMHICHPYGGARADYYYPARRELILFFAGMMLQLPYVFFPSDPATWMYIRIFGTLYYPVGFILLMRRYFDRYKLHKDWRGVFYVWLPMGCIGVLGVLSQTVGEWMVAHAKLIYLLTGCVGGLCTLYILLLGHQLKKKITKFHYDNYSCERDFPLLFAQKVLYTPLIWCSVMWLILLTGNPWLKFGSDLLFALWMVLFLGCILHPQRARAIRRQPSTQKVAEEPQLATDAARESIQLEVAAVIERMYLNSSLLKTDVIAEMEYGKKTLAKEYLSEVGFYNFVNAYRLKHAQCYKEKHPKATLDEVATAAGFRDRFALNYAKGKMKNSDRLLTRHFCPSIDTGTDKR